MLKRISLSLVITLTLSLLAVIARPAHAQEDLDARFESSDGALIFNFPADWYAEEFFLPGVAFMGTSQAALYAMQTGAPPDANSLLFNIFGPQASSNLFEDEFPASLDEALAAFTMTGDGMEFSDPTAVTIGDYEALYVTATGLSGEGLGIAIAINDGYALVSASAAIGEFEQFEDTVWAIVETIRYTVPAGMIRFSSDNIYFDYPADWHFNEVMQGTYIVYNDLTMSTTPEPGQIMILIAIPDSVVMMGLPDHVDSRTLADEFTTQWVEGERTIGEEDAITIGEYEAIQFGFASAASEGYLIFVTTNSNPLAILVSVATGELADFETKITAVLESVVYKSGQ